MDNQINTNKPLIMHIDLNSCFATIEQQANPLLRNKPIIVAAYATENGCILSPSIEAKKYGIKTGMKVKDAKIICPTVIIRTPDPNKYRDVHQKFISIFSQYCPYVFPRSIDEAILDFSSVRHMYPNLIDVANEIKKRMRDEIGECISASIGISTNNFLAKLGASIKKPDGLLVIDYRNLLRIYGSITLLDFQGINVRFESRLNHAGIYSPIEMFQASYQTLQKKAFHSIIGKHWYYKLRGWETDQLEFPRKTYGHQYALRKKTKNIAEISNILMKLCEKTGRRLRKKGYVANGIHISLRFSNYTFWHKGKKLFQATWTTNDLYKQAKNILLQSPLVSEITLISIHCFNLSRPTGYQESLLDMSIIKKTAITKAVDEINDKFGEFTIIPATMIDMENIVVDRIAFGRSSLEENTLDTISFSATE